MQTFLPFPNFVVSALVLDYRRLGKQRVECSQLQNALQSGGSSGWRQHPACVMWEQHIVALMLYRDCCIREWVRRGYNNNMPMMLESPSGVLVPTQADMPPWLGDEELHASHRGNLLRKDPTHYEQFGWDDPLVEGYLWPVPDDSEKGYHLRDMRKKQ